MYYGWLHTFSLKFFLFDTYEVLDLAFHLILKHSVSGGSSYAYSLNTSPKTSIQREMYITPSFPAYLTFQYIFKVFPSPHVFAVWWEKGVDEHRERRRENTFNKKIKLSEAEIQRFTTYSQSPLAYFVQRHCFGMRRGWFLCLQFQTSYLMFLLMCQTQSQCLWK